MCLHYCVHHFKTYHFRCVNTRYFMETKKLGEKYAALYGRSDKRHDYLQIVLYLQFLLQQLLQ